MLKNCSLCIAKWSSKTTSSLEFKKRERERERESENMIF